MTVKRFVAGSARECLRRVKDELGPDAIVISNKPLEHGVEIVAMTPDSLDALSAGTTSSAPESAVMAPQVRAKAAAPDDDYTVTLSAASRRNPAIRPWTPPAAVPLPAATADAGAPLRPLPPRAAPAEPAAATALPGSAAGMERSPASPLPAEVMQLRDEMRLIKGLLERQLSGFAWGEMARAAPVRACLLGEMIESGFSGELARRLVQDLPDDMTPDEGRKWVKSAVNRRLRTLPAEADFIDRGGVYAIVGPTGVGKTTTTAKLAARCVVRYGADRLALLTTDGYRIGAQEQLRIYGRILGVPVFVVRDGEDLRRTLADLRDKHMVLIDTVGMSQRDRMVADQVAMLTRAGEVNRLLLLNAGARGDTLDDVVRAYGGEDLAGCIMTKVDEAAALAPALDCVLRHGLTLSYVANGQRVPEDLHLPNRAYLLHRAFKVGAGETPHRLHGDEIGLAAAPRAEATGVPFA